MTLRVIHPKSGTEREWALRLLFSEFPAEDMEARRRELESLEERGIISLNGLLLACEDDRPVGAALWSPQPDRTALVWPPATLCHAAEAEAAKSQLLQTLIAEIATEGYIAQAMLSPEEIDSQNRLQSAGFVHAAQLFFLGRSVTTEETLPAEPPSQSWNVTTYRDDLEHRFVKVVASSYEDSLDCPFMAGRRTASEALAGHRQAGVFCPDLWMIFSDDTGDVAVLLLADHPQQQAVELVYMGVAPASRGKGYGNRVLQRALHLTQQRGREMLFLAVDATNCYANTIYREQGFVELVQRNVFLCDQRSQEQQGRTG